MKTIEERAKAFCENNICVTCGDRKNCDRKCLGTCIPTYDALEWLIQFGKSERYGLTQAVIEGRKTMTRRVLLGIDFPVNMVSGRAIPNKEGKIHAVADGKDVIVKLRYKVGEVVAVAQCYYNAFSSRCDIPVYGADRTPGWINKMFVRADLMPHRIRITGIRCEPLWAITDEDCMKEGVREHPYRGYVVDGILYKNSKDKEYNGSLQVFNTPREAFAALIDKVSGRGTWRRNPWVVVYEFELVE